MATLVCPYHGYEPSSGGQALGYAGDMSPGGLTRAMAKAIYHLKEPALPPVGSCHRITMVAVGT